MSSTLRVLIAPLDWGLGHATRCIPVIKALLEHSCEVFIAAEGQHLLLLRNHFPTLKSFEIKGYRIQYSKSKTGFLWKILFQIPKILKSIRNEHSWLERTANQYHFDLIISDNRYGFYHQSIPSVIMTHQLNILSGWGSISDVVVRQINYRLLERFSEKWIVDMRKNGLAGKLSHSEKTPLNTKYVGVLSQFDWSNTQKSLNSILILLSGPEPQRGIVEKVLLAQLSDLKEYSFVFVGGKKGHFPPINASQIRYIDFIQGEQLLELILNSALVICRSGYSTIMDLFTLQKNAFFIPTPGQTEQEYLAKHLSEKYGFYYTNQKDIDLKSQIPEALQRQGFENTHRENSNLKSVIQEVVQRIIS